MGLPVVGGHLGLAYVHTFPFFGQPILLADMQVVSYSHVSWCVELNVVVDVVSVMAEPDW